MSTILIATDGSPEAREAVDYGLELAAGDDANVVLLQVIPPIDWTQLDRGAVIRPIPEEIALRRSLALDEAARARGESRRAGRRPRCSPETRPTRSSPTPTTTMST